VAFEDSACAAETDRGSLLTMKKTKAVSARNAKLAAKKNVAARKARARALAPKKKPAAKVHSPIARKTVRSVRKAPVSIASGKGTQYDRQVFTRFDAPEIKEMVRKAANSAGVSLSGYIAAAAVKLAKEGWKPEAAVIEKEAAAAAG
jgi:hypothetical protein